MPRRDPARARPRPSAPPCREPDARRPPRRRRSGPGTELAQVRPYAARRRRAPDRLERDRAHAGAARARARGRAGADHLADARQLALDAASAPPTGARPTSPRAWRSSSASGEPARQPPGRATFGGRAAHAAAARRAASACSALLTALRAEPSRTAAGATSLGEALAPRRRRPATARPGRSSSPTSAGRATGRPAAARFAAATACSPSRSAIRASRRCPPSAICWLVDPETGRQLRVDTRQPASCASASPPRPRRSARGRVDPAPRRRGPRRAVHRRRLVA